MLKILKCKYMGHWSSHLILIFWVSQWITVKIPYIKWQYRNLQTSWSWGKVRNAVGSRLPTWVSPDCSIPRSSHSPIWILSSSPSGIEPRNFSSVPDITRKRSVRIVSLRCIYAFVDCDDDTFQCDFVWTMDSGTQGWKKWFLVAV